MKALHSTEKLGMICDDVWKLTESAVTRWWWKCMTRKVNRLSDNKWNDSDNSWNCVNLHMVDTEAGYEVLKVATVVYRLVDISQSHLANYEVGAPPISSNLCTKYSVICANVPLRTTHSLTPNLCVGHQHMPSVWSRKSVGYGLELSARVLSWQQVVYAKDQLWWRRQPAAVVVFLLCYGIHIYIQAPLWAEILYLSINQSIFICPDGKYSNSMTVVYVVVDRTVRPKHWSLPLDKRKMKIKY